MGELLRRSCIAGALLALAAAPSRAGEDVPYVACLEGDAGRAAIVDESVEPYFSVLRAREIAAKTGLTADSEEREKLLEACRQAYRDAILDFTADEKALLQWYADRVRNALKDRYPRFAAIPWRFLKLAEHIEGGLPHTRGACIVFSPDVLDYLQRFKRSGSEAMALAQGGALFVHEQMHVYQRANPAACAELYEQGWGFRKASVAAFPALDERRIVNPDGVRDEWAYPIRAGEAVRWIQPTLVLRAHGGAPRMPHDFEMLAVEVVPGEEGAFAVRTGDDGKPVARPLFAERGYVEAFTPSGNIYHPNETAADLFASMVARELFAPGKAGTDTPAEVALRAWAAKHFGPAD